MATATEPLVLELPKYLGGEVPLEDVTVTSDFTGTVSRDGKLLEGVVEVLRALSSRVRDIWFITADTFGTAQEALSDLPVNVHVLMPPDTTGAAKPPFISTLDAKFVVAVGNGRNDVEMFRNSAHLRIAVMSSEGVAGDLLQITDIVVTHPCDAFGLLLTPDRLKATLRD